MSLDTNRYFKNFMVMSGMNIDLLKIEKQKGDKYKILMGSYGLEYLINETTRKTNTTESCIDHVYTRVQNKNRLSIAATFIRRQVTYHYLTAVRLICRGVRGSSDMDGQQTVTRIYYEQLVTCLMSTEKASVAYDLLESTFLQCIGKRKAEKIL